MLFTSEEMTMAESTGSACDGLYARLGELQTMTPTDAVIAQYFEDSFPHLALENLDEISAATGASTASVTRFVRKLGYASFRDFSRSLREEVAVNFDLPSDRTTNGPIPNEPGAMWRSKMDAARRSIDVGLNSMDGEAFDRVVEVLRDDSRPLYLVAAASGHPLLDYFQTLVRYYRREVVTQIMSCWSHRNPRRLSAPGPAISSCWSRWWLPWPLRTQRWNARGSRGCRGSSTSWESSSLCDTGSSVRLTSSNTP